MITIWALDSHHVFLTVSESHSHVMAICSHPSQLLTSNGEASREDCESLSCESHLTTVTKNSHKIGCGHTRSHLTTVLLKDTFSSPYYVYKSRTTCKIMETQIKIPVQTRSSVIDMEPVNAFQSNLSYRVVVSIE